jgi:hypothetical protein
MSVYDTSIRRTPWKGIVIALMFLALAFLTDISALARPTAVPQVDVAPQQNRPSKLFLPIIIGSGSAKEVPPPTVPTAGGVFPQGDIDETESAAMAVDAAGGMHIAYRVRVADIDNPPAYYGYCPAPAATCIDPAAWHMVMFPGQVQQVELALTPAGKPRLLYKTTNYTGGANADYNYAECNGDCTDPNAWAVADVAATAEVDTSTGDVAHREFALDPQGRPRFIFYTDTFGPANGGVPRTLYYMACDANCTNPNSWTATDLNPSHNYDIFSHPVLAFTAQGQPRVLTERVTSGGVPTNIHYMACDTTCTNVFNWMQLPLFPRGYGTNPSWDLAINAQGGLRVAFYQGTSTNSSTERLFYIWCDANCLNSNAWFGQLLMNDGNGENPDLALDGQGRPRIAYNDVNGAGLGYLWCNTVCESGSGTWTTKIAESSDLLDATFPLGTIPSCDRVSWAGAAKPQLALDAAGNAYVGYVAQRLIRCYSGTPPKSYVSHLDYARFSFFPQP